MFTISLRFLVYTYVLLSLAFERIASIQIKTISSTIFITSDVINTFSNTTCSDCTCLGWTTQAVAWNCIMNTSTCQLISKYSSTNGYMQLTTNGSFFYLPSTTGNKDSSERKANDLLCSDASQSVYTQTDRICFFSFL